MHKSFTAFMQKDKKAGMMPRQRGTLHSIAAFAASTCRLSALHASACAALLAFFLVQHDSFPRILENQLTSKANARSGELRYPLAVGDHLAWPAEAARAQVGRCAQAKGIVGLITLPVDLIVLTPVQRAHFTRNPQKGRQYPTICTWFNGFLC